MPSKVVVIEDDPDILEAISLALKSGDYQPLPATSGRNGYAIAQNEQPDVVVIDYLLSGQNGQLICHKLKADEQTKHIPIIMLSAHPNAKQVALDSGADAFLAKPFSVKEFLYQIDRLIEDDVASPDSSI